MRCGLSTACRPSPGLHLLDRFQELFLGTGFAIVPLGLAPGATGYGRESPDRARNGAAHRRGGRQVHEATRAEHVSEQGFGAGAVSEDAG
jgi:hypothetical protein